MTAPIPIDARWRDAADDALDRFHAQWPPERCRNLAALIDGTPAEREEAQARVLAKALAHSEPASPADAAVRDLIAGTGLRPDQIARNERDRRILKQRLEVERRKRVRRAVDRWGKS